MLAAFHGNLAYLRRLKRVHQREAAASLGVSQALLSHYEKGLREPGLEFLSRAADYYGVSADYLLGRTGDMTGGRATVDPAQFSDREESRRTAARLKAEKIAAQEAVGALFDLCERLDTREAAPAAARHLRMELYRLFVFLHLIAGHGTGCRDLFVLPRRYVDAAASSEQGAAEFTLLRLASEVAGNRRTERFNLTPEALTQEFGERGERLLAELVATGKILEEKMGADK